MFDNKFDPEKETTYNGWEIIICKLWSMNPKQKKKMEICSTYYAIVEFPSEKLLGCICMVV